MKRSIIALAVILMMTLSSCGKGNHSDYSKVYESYGDIKNYAATVKVTTNPGTDESVYTANQYYVAPDLYRIDYTSEGMENTSSVLKGNKLYFKGPDGNVTEFNGYVPHEKYYVFITDFMERYIKTEKAKNNPKGKKTVLELKENRNDPQRASMKLFINNKDYSPEKLVTYNDSGDEVIVVEFKNFKMNDGINKKIFDL